MALPTGVNASFVDSEKRFVRGATLEHYSGPDTCRRGRGCRTFEIVAPQASSRRGGARKNIRTSPGLALLAPEGARLGHMNTGGTRRASACAEGTALRGARTLDRGADHLHPALLCGRISGGVADKGDIDSLAPGFWRQTASERAPGDGEQKVWTF